MNFRTMDENINEQQSGPELNEDGIPRPAPDPNNRLYVVISLAVFLVGYLLYNYASKELFLPYSRTVFAPDEAKTAILVEETLTALPEGASISRARISSGTDGDLLHVWYKDIGSTEDFPEKLGFSYSDPEEDVQSEIFRDEGFEKDIVFADIYVSNEDPGLYCLIYEYNGSSYAEFCRNGSGRAVNAVFSDSPKIKDRSQADEKRERLRRR
ncbi:MAG: hypothetical protein II664_09005 [Oscillospiraceae bacterium]|nr:hypothetical protein [Oscillospiraceae bacterium]